eukprot:CAMPEP_0117570812 /NCGR_PEP_ID=MMETSP0784-20121206/59400_1 /TAXON_ID=39447 /ORGANISM="" /LENGTH=624 /DNA_ID=CAMNT_0005368895 /DNA_START=15 /DNA_END=1887 /DNA_ORIENTATION=-
MSRRMLWACAARATLQGASRREKLRCPIRTCLQSADVGIRQSSSQRGFLCFVRGRRRPGCGAGRSSGPPQNHDGDENAWTAYMLAAACALVVGAVRALAELDAVAYNAAVSACLWAGRWKLVYGFLLVMRFDGVSLDVATFAIAIGAINSGGGRPGMSSTNSHSDRRAGASTAAGQVLSWVAAYALLAELQGCALQPPVISCNTIARELARAMRWRMVCDLVRCLQSDEIRLTDVTWNTAMDACEKSRQWPSALQVMRELQRLGFVADAVTIGIAVKSYGSASCEKGSTQWVRASDIFGVCLQSSAKLSVTALNSAVSMCKGGLHWAWSSLALARWRSGGMVLDIITYGAYMDLLKACGRWCEGLDVLHVVSRRGIQVDVVALSAATSSLENSLQWDLALGMLVGFRRRGLEPGVFTQSAVLSACEKSAIWERATTIFSGEESRALFHDGVPFTVLVSACGRAAAWQLSLGWTRRARRSGFLDATTCDAAVAACVWASRWVGALALIRTADATGSSAGMASDAGDRASIGCATAISACESRNAWLTCLQLLREIRLRRDHPDVAAHRGALRACGLSTRWRAALVLLLGGVQKACPSTDAETFGTLWSAASWACEAAGRCAPPLP